MAQGLSLTPAQIPIEARSPYTGQTINIQRGERWLSLVGGGALLVFGIKKHGLWGLASALLGCEMLRRGISRHSFLYQALHIKTAPQTPSSAGRETFYCRTERAITINRPPQEVYLSWHHFEQLPDILSVLKEVQVQNLMHSRWVIVTPGGFSFAWEAEIISEEPSQHISWRTRPGSAIAQRGIIEFTPAPGGRGTEVKVVLDYHLPGGKPADLLARAFGIAPDQRLRESLRQFKARMETGELPTT